MSLLYCYTYFKINVKFIFICLLWVLVARHRTFSCGMWDLIPWPGIKPGAPALGAWTCSHWTSREVPVVLFIFVSHETEAQRGEMTCPHLTNEETGFKILQSLWHFQGTGYQRKDFKNHLTLNQGKMTPRIIANLLVSLGTYLNLATPTSVSCSSSKPRKGK